MKCLSCISLNSVVSLYGGSRSKLQLFIANSSDSRVLRIGYCSVITVCNVQRLTEQQLVSFAKSRFCSLIDFGTTGCNSLYICHIGKNIVDRLLHISASAYSLPASTFSLSLPPCVPIIILIAMYTQEQAINFTFQNLAPTAGQTLRRISVVGSHQRGGFYTPDTETTVCMLM